ncbi:hypothetical protein ABIB38_003214 [Massilia sp. UYP11]|uniref:hypothetical protein n=1 Tax=Massilia sp. UYP11 TaxID=1756385 RepID=UPI003D20E448
MKKTHQSVAIAGLLAVALAISGCTSMRDESSSSGASGSTGTSDYGEGSSGSSGASGTSGTSTETIHDGAGVSGSSDTSGSSGASGTSGSGTSSMHDDRGGSASTAGAAAASAAPNSTVLAIEIMPASSGITEGDASMGTTGAAGATGSQSYRVTVRMDDGSTQVITHGTTPDFRSGDRVNVTGGSIQR